MTLASIMPLIDRLEQGPVYLTHKEAYDLAIWFGSDVALGLASIIRKAFAGGSLDAALALAERVLPGGYTVRADIYPDRSVFCIDPPWKSLDDARSQSIISGEAATPALALVAAILQARLREEGRET